MLELVSGFVIASIFYSALLHRYASQAKHWQERCLHAEDRMYECLLRPLDENGKEFIEIR